jgi:hypothetical protein
MGREYILIIFSELFLYKYNKRYIRTIRVQHQDIPEPASEQFACHCQKRIKGNNSHRIFFGPGLVGAPTPPYINPKGTALKKVVTRRSRFFYHRRSLFLIRIIKISSLFGPTL